jgi:hypothetical protein
MLDDVTIDLVRFRRDTHEGRQGGRREVYGTIGDETDRDLSPP